MDSCGIIFDLCVKKTELNEQEMRWGLEGIVIVVSHDERALMEGASALRTLPMMWHRGLALLWQRLRYHALDRWWDSISSLSISLSISFI